MTDTTAIPPALIGHVTTDESTSCNGASGSDYEPLDMNPVEWGGVWDAVAYINGYASRAYPKKSLTDEADPLNVAFSLISSIYDWLIKNDPDHASPRHVNTVFMRCRLFDKLYGKINGLHHKKYPDDATGGWNEEQASRKIAEVKKEHEEKAERKKKGIKSKGEQELIEECNCAAKKRRAVALALKPNRFHAPMTAVDYANIIAYHSDLYILGIVRDEKDKPHPAVDLDVFRQLWNEFAQIARIQESHHDGCVWYNGALWNVEETAGGIEAGIDLSISLATRKRAEELASEHGITIESVVEMFRNALSQKTRPRDIAVYRERAPSISLKVKLDQGFTCTDGVIIVGRDDAKVHITEHDPETDFWLEDASISVKKILPDIETITRKDIYDKYPNCKAALLACGEDKLDLMATLATVAMYYTMPRYVKSLDGWYYLWDNADGGTGKSTHIDKFKKLFGRYFAGVSWDIFTGQNIQNGDFWGKIGVICDEAKVNYVDDAEKIKNFTTGGWSLKKMYCDPVTIDQPLLMISCGNVKPLLKKAANSQPIYERLQPCEFTIKHRNTGEEFGCSDEEYMECLLNLGINGCVQLMKRGSAACKKDLPFFVDVKNIQDLCTRVPWRDELTEIGEWVSKNEEPLSAVLTALRDHLAAGGWTDDELKGAPELRSRESFRKVMDGIPMPIFNNYNNVVEKKPLKVVEKNSQSIQYQTDKYWVKNIKLKNIRAGESSTGKEPQRVLPAGNPDGSRFVNGKIYGNTETGVITHILPYGEDVMNWDVSKFIGKEDPVKIVKKSPLTGKPLYFKPVTFVLSGNTLTDIIP